MSCWFMYVCMYVRMYVCLYIYIYVYTSCLLITSRRDVGLSKLTISMLTVKYHFHITNDQGRCLDDHSSDVILNLFCW
jgi:hypothetical protein